VPTITASSFQTSGDEAFAMICSIVEYEFGKCGGFRFGGSNFNNSSISKKTSILICPIDGMLMECLFKYLKNSFSTFARLAIK